MLSTTWWMLERLSIFSSVGSAFGCLNTSNFSENQGLLDDKIGDCNQEEITEMFWQTKESRNCCISEFNRIFGTTYIHQIYITVNKQAEVSIRKLFSYSRILLLLRVQLLNITFNSFFAVQ
ncbi:Hypothetical_protein [Hexamita inflata]|uniref:Hypothetical_protein n=1 Tax=Hexamita inflata TaxID=28002 RepID=A0AA86R7E1_9EUKA|nr:Hypothetical protein HINF_LOCUS60709 [Hexamita inflata]